MGKFLTKLPTKANSFIESLSKRATIEGITLDPETRDVLILWSNEDLYTGLTVPVDYPAELVKRQELPKGVCKASDRAKATKTLPAKQNAPEANQTPKQAIVAPLYLTEEQLAECTAKGEAVEFQGVLPKWMPFDPKKDTFKEGYFYRRVEKRVDQAPVAA